MPVRSSERVDFKRCPTKWYWKWRLGLVPKQKSFGALDLGTWMHNALAVWYCAGFKRWGKLSGTLDVISQTAIDTAQRNNAPDYEITKANELAELGIVLAKAYEAHHGRDPDIDVIKAEIPLEFTFDIDGEKVTHTLTPDLLYRHRVTKQYWLMEHKTAATIQLGHLVIDDQARPYGAMAERALKSAGVFGPRDSLSGIMYNFIRKAVPDGRETNEQGQYLNKNGTVSKKQPPPYFVRHPVVLTRSAKARTIERLRGEVFMVTKITNHLRSGEIDPANLPITPHRSCPRFCDYFTMCHTKENGGDITELRKQMFIRQNPYVAPETADEALSFEMV